MGGGPRIITLLAGVFSVAALLTAGATNAQQSPGAAVVTSEQAKWRKVIREANVRID